MANKNKNQGTWWETFNEKAFQAAGRFARRLQEGGIGDEGDVYVEGHYGDEDELPKVALAWRRFIKKPGAKRRSTRHVVILDHDLFVEMVSQLRYSWVIECKATESLSVTTALAKAEAKVEKNWRAGK